MSDRKTLTVSDFPAATSLAERKVAASRALSAASRKRIEAIIEMDIEPPAELLADTFARWRDAGRCLFVRAPRSYLLMLELVEAMVADRAEVSCTVQETSGGDENSEGGAE